MVMEKSKIKNHIKQLIASCDDSLSKKDIATLLKDYDDGIVLFDVGTQLTGKEDFRKIWEECFPYFGSTIGTERKEMEIHVCDDMAVVHGYSRLSGMDSTSDMARSWLRTTVCYKKVDGQWKVFHEHISLPVNCELEKPSYILDSEEK